MGKKEEKYIYVTENCEKIDIMYDIFKLHQGLREEYYLLNSLRDTLDGFMLIAEEDNQIEIENKFKELNERIEVFCYIYKKIDEAMIDLARIDDIVKALTTSGITFWEDDLHNSIENEFESAYILITIIIRVSEEMQKTLCDVMLFILNAKEHFNEELSKTNKEANLIYSENKLLDCIEKNFRRSVNEDKIINYQILSNKDIRGEDKQKFNRVINKYDKKSKRLLIKKRDNSYNINILKGLIEKEYKYTIELRRYITEVNHSNQLKKFNNGIFILTLISPIVGFISILPILDSLQNRYGNEIIIILGIVIFIIIYIILSKCNVIKYEE